MKILFKVFLLGLIGVMFSGCFIVMPPDKETVMAQQLDVWCILRERKDMRNLYVKQSRSLIKISMGIEFK